MVGNLVKEYFPHIGTLQVSQYDVLPELYHEWNAKINVISRKDMDSLPTRHVLHSLAIAKFIQLRAGTRVMDIGTGGGFPGIPLAIMFPEVHFHLMDSVGKKIKVADAVIEAIGLSNVTTAHGRVEEHKMKYDFMVSRAVAGIDKLLEWSRKNIAVKQQNAMPNGIIALKGGDPKDELKLLKKGAYVEIVSLETLFNISIFEEKYLLYLPV